MLIELGAAELEQPAVQHASSRGIKIEALSEHALPGYRGSAGLLVGVGGLAEGAIAHVVEVLAQTLAAVGELSVAA
jgi:hypothetical protein